MRDVKAGTCYATAMERVRHYVDNGDGWHLALNRFGPARPVEPSRPPVLIVPGYGMNAFIFSYHPSGDSLVHALVHAGFEVWTVDLRSQGASVALGGAGPDTLDALALVDLPAAVAGVLERTGSHAGRVSVVGASLGGALMLSYAVHEPTAPLGALVSIGSPVKWVRIHPLVRAAFSSSRLAGALPVKGTRAMASALLPPLVRFAPWALGLYLNPEETDTSAHDELVKTVEDPSRGLNRELARWIKRGDLVVGGVNVAEGIGALRHPFLCVAGNGDGVVPLETASWPLSAIGSPQKSLLVAGDQQTRFAHAELFIGRSAGERVFAPLARFLADHG